jgi:hypothetical protein
MRNRMVGVLVTVLMMACSKKPDATSSPPAVPHPPAVAKIDPQFAPTKLGLLGDVVDLRERLPFDAVIPERFEGKDAKRAHLPMQGANSLEVDLLTWPTTAGDAKKPLFAGYVLEVMANPNGVSVTAMQVIVTPAEVTLRVMAKWPQADFTLKGRTLPSNPAVFEKLTD